MFRYVSAVFALVICSCGMYNALKIETAIAEEGSSPASSASGGEERESGPAPGEVQVVSENGSITRARCPYGCSDRKLPKKSCREWRSKMYPDVCYVEDTSLPSSAIAK